MKRNKLIVIITVHFSKVRSEIENNFQRNVEQFPLLGSISQKLGSNQKTEKRKKD